MTPSRWLLALALLVSGCSNKKVQADIDAEAARREAYARGASEDGGTASLWNVSSTNDIIYVDGFTIILHDPPEDYKAPAFRWMAQNSYVRLRAHGTSRTRLFLLGWCHIKELRTRPVVSAYIDGQLVGTTGAVEENGHWHIDQIIEPAVLRGKTWVDLNIVVSSVAYHWAEPPELRVVVLNVLTWDKLP